MRCDVRPLKARSRLAFSFCTTSSGTLDGAATPYETPIGVTTADTVPAFGICEPTFCNDYYAIRTRIPLTKTWTRWFVRLNDIDLAQYGSPTLRELREAVERDYILRKLEETGWNVTRTAEILGIERTNLHKKLKALGLSRDD